mgnify:CR=1 FL=1
MEISRKLYITIQGTCGTLLTSEEEEDEAAATQKKSLYSLFVWSIIPLRFSSIQKYRTFALAETEARPLPLLSKKI